MDIPPTAARILDVAERMARTGGYSGFSFREIATEIEIKPASVHYHFPTKADLGAALAERYTARFLKALGQPTDAPPAELRRRYVDAFRTALQADRLMCLCGMFGSEVQALPDPPLTSAAHRLSRLRNEPEVTTATHPPRPIGPGRRHGHPTSALPSVG